MTKSWKKMRPLETDDEELEEDEPEGLETDDEELEEDDEETKFAWTL